MTTKFYLKNYILNTHIFDMYDLIGFRYIFYNSEDF